MIIHRFRLCYDIWIINQRQTNNNTIQWNIFTNRINVIILIKKRKKKLFYGGPIGCLSVISWHFIICYHWCFAIWIRLIWCAIVRTLFYIHSLGFHCCVWCTMFKCTPYFRTAKKIWKIQFIDNHSFSHFFIIWNCRIRFQYFILLYSNSNSLFRVTNVELVLSFFHRIVWRIE